MDQKLGIEGKNRLISSQSQNFNPPGPPSEDDILVAKIYSMCTLFGITFRPLYLFYSLYIYFTLLSSTSSYLCLL